MPRARPDHDEGEFPFWLKIGHVPISDEDYDALRAEFPICFDEEPLMPHPPYKVWRAYCEKRQRLEWEALRRMHAGRGTELGEDRRFEEVAPK